MRPVLRHHLLDLADLDDAAFARHVHKLGQELSRGLPSPFDRFVHLSLAHATLPLASVPRRRDWLGDVVARDLGRVGADAFEQDTALLPAPYRDPALHIVPAAPGSGGGLSMAPGVVLALVVPDELAEARLRRNVAHELSHGARQVRKPQLSQYGYGPQVSYTTRDYLMFEGLAEVLADTLYPAPIAPPMVTPEQEAAWWATVDLDAVGFGAYGQYCSNAVSGQIGARIVRAFLSRHGVDVVQAHAIDDEALYHQSGYPHLR